MPTRAGTSVASLFRAEWQKTLGNRWVVGFLIWSFPVGALAFVIVMGLIIALVGTGGNTGTEELGLADAQWTDQAIATWSVPNSLMGRLLVVAFTSVVFAGEYQWQTWKGVIPRYNRVPLLLIKYVTVALLVVLTFVITSIILSVGWGILATLAGESYGPAITGAVVREFVLDYVQEAWLALTLTTISAGYAALAAMVTRSILGGVLVSVAATYAEGLSVLALILFAYFLDMPRIVELYRLTPSYNVSNVNSWITYDRAQTFDQVNDLELLDTVFTFADSLAFSLVVLTLWVMGTVGLTAYLFNRQDIT